MIKSKIMKNHCIPVVALQRLGDIPGYIIVYFRKILMNSFSAIFLYITSFDRLTETKKLEVPSALSKVSGNSFNQVSSPNITIFPVPFAFICASHVSCVAKDEVVSDSAKFKITSRKDGMEPVVMALILGMVIVGDVACAVKGSAAPSEMRLQASH
jgi:hypothetical protein